MLGFEFREVKRAGYWQAVYQALMRASPRNPEDMYPKTVIVMDRATADWLASMFPGCMVEVLGGIDGIPAKGTPGRRHIYECEADRKRAHRRQFKSELRIALDLVGGGERAARHGPQIAILRCQMSSFGFGEDTTLTVRAAPIWMPSAAQSTSITMPNHWTSSRWTTWRRSSMGCATSTSSPTRARR